MGSVKGVTPAVVEIVTDRDLRRCARCYTPITGERGRDWSIHHRRPRGMGGSRVPWVNKPGNLLLLCGSGVTGCHGWVESNRDEARKLGFLVSALGTDIPSHVPVWHSAHGWVLMDDYGGLHNQEVPF